MDFNVAVPSGSFSLQALQRIVSPHLTVETIVADADSAMNTGNCFIRLRNDS